MSHFIKLYVILASESGIKKHKKLLLSDQSTLKIVKASIVELFWKAQLCPLYQHTKPFYIFFTVPVLDAVVLCEDVELSLLSGDVLDSGGGDDLNDDGGRMSENFM